MPPKLLKIRGPQTSDVWKRQRSERPVIIITETMFEFSCHAFFLNWLFGCRFFFPHFVFEGALMPPTPQSWWGELSGLSAAPSKNLPEVLLMARKATGDFRGLIGPHLCIGTIIRHFWFLTRNEWGGKVMCRRQSLCVSKCMSLMKCVCMCVCLPDCMVVLYSVWGWNEKRGQRPINCMRGLLICIINYWH